MPKQNRPHIKGESVWHLGLEGDNPSCEPKNGHHQVCWAAPLLRYVRHVAFATYYGAVFLSPSGQKKKAYFEEMTGLEIQIGEKNKSFA